MNNHICQIHALDAEKKEASHFVYENGEKQAAVCDFCANNVVDHSKIDKLEEIDEAN